MRLTLYFLLLSTIAYGQPIADFKSQPVLAWTFNIHGPLTSSPIIHGDRVFVGGSDSSFYALSLRDGKIQWKIKTQGPIRSTPIVEGDRIYLNGGDGNLYCLNKTSGKKDWVHNGNGERKYDFADYHHSSPTIFNGIVYYGGGNNLFAVDKNGKRLWSFQAGDVVHTKPAIEGNRIFIGSHDGNLYALEIATGKELWHFKTIGHRYFPKGEAQGSPTTFGNMVFFGARDYNVYALDQQTGKNLWNKAFGRGWVLTNAVDDSVLYMAGADERVLIAADPVFGREIWKKNMEFLMFGKPSFTGEMLYIGTTIGKLHGIDRKTGEKLWTITTEGYRKNHLKYFKEDDSNRDDIYSIIRSNEQFLDVEYELGGIFSTPALNENYIVFSSGEGVLYGLKRPE